MDFAVAPTPAKGSSARRSAVIVLRIGLTAAAAFFFYQAYLNVRATLTPVDESAADRFWNRQLEEGPLDRTRPRLSTQPTPWPRYPGAKLQASTLRPGSNSPFIVEDLEIRGSSREIRKFYRGALRRRGWTDMSDGARGQSQLAAAGHTALQQERILRDFDELTSSILIMEKKDHRVMISIEDGNQRWKKMVRLTSFPAGAVETIDEIFSGKPVPGRRHVRTYPRLDHTSRFGPDTFNTEVLTSSQPAGAFFVEQEAELQRQGWTRSNRANVPIGDIRPGSKVGFYTRGTDGTLLVVSPHEGARGSGASVTRIEGMSP